MRKVGIAISRIRITLIRPREASAHLEKVGVALVLGTRVNLEGVDPNIVVKGRTIQTTSGRVVPAELIVSRVCLPVTNGY